MTNASMNAGSPANPTVASVIRDAVNEWNRLDRQECDEDNAEAEPGEELAEPANVTIEQVIAELVEPTGACRDAVQDALDAILQAVHAEHPIDPWPELTRQEVQFLVGGRRITNDRWRLRYMIGRHADDMAKPLSLREKIIAARHREWLEKDIDKRCTKLAKAKALVASMEGMAA